MKMLHWLTCLVKQRHLRFWELVLTWHIVHWTVVRCVLSLRVLLSCEILYWSASHCWLRYHLVTVQLRNNNLFFKYFFFSSFINRRYSVSIKKWCLILVCLLYFLDTHSYSIFWLLRKRITSTRAWCSAIGRLSLLFHFKLVVTELSCLVLRVFQVRA